MREELKALAQAILEGKRNDAVELTQEAGGCRRYPQADTG